MLIAFAFRFRVAADAARPLLLRLESCVAVRGSENCDKASAVHRMPSKAMHRLSSEGMRRLAIVVGVAASLAWTVLVMVISRAFLYLQPRGWLLFLIGIPISFCLGFSLIWAIDWVMAGFRVSR